MFTNKWIVSDCLQFRESIVTLLAKVQYSTCCPPPGYGRGDNLILFFTTVQEMNGDIIKAYECNELVPFSCPVLLRLFSFSFLSQWRSLPLVSRDFRVFHNNSAVPQDHRKRCRIRSQDRRMAVQCATNLQTLSSKSPLNNQKLMLSLNI